MLLPSFDSRGFVVSYKRKHVHKVLVNCLVKLTQEKSVARWTDHPNMTIAVNWEVKKETNQAHLSMNAQRWEIVVDLPQAIYCL